MQRGTLRGGGWDLTGRATFSFAQKPEDPILSHGELMIQWVLVFCLGSVWLWLFGTEDQTQGLGYAKHKLYH